MLLPLTASTHPGRHGAAPLKRLCALHPPDLDIETPDLPTPSERRRLLLVESDPTMRALLLEMLSRQYEVEAVSDSMSAWHVVQCRPPAFVIIDLYASGIDSLILTRSLRASPQMAKLPIVLLTVSADRELMLRCLAAGASNFLLKPFGMVDLLAFVRVELDLHGTPSVARR